jgi:hypothetical protein
VLLAASGEVVRVGVAGTLVLLAVLLVRALLARPAAAVRPVGASLGRRKEVALLLLTLGGALSMRTLGASAGLTPPFWFSQTEPLYVHEILRREAFWTTWLETFRNFQVGWLHDSPLMLPVAAAFQRLLGPSFELPLLLGAFYGGTAVLLAWAVGRAVVSPAFGLLFAAFVSASPLQLVWSRLGGLYIASVPQVLLTLWCGYQAGRRRSVPLALLSGVVTWTSIYYYYAARVALPLGLLAVIMGARHARASGARTLVLCLGAAVAPVALYLALNAGTAITTLWPNYRGYVGNRGETTLPELFARNAQPVAQESLRALERYFLYDRAGYESRESWFRWDVRSGGLCLLPTALLGLLGLAATLRHPRRHVLWLATALAGLALPALSVSTARRFLIFDLAWCALAAAGVLALLDSPIGRALPRRLRPVAAAAIPLTVAGWSLATVVALNAVLAGARVPIPFGESGFGDGLTCRRCFGAGRAWQREIADNGFVVLADTDVVREDPTSPGGLPLYGKLGALAAGRPENFVEFYALAGNWDRQPPKPGAVFDTAAPDYASHLIQRIERARPDRIIWHFESPTQWERWFAGRLALMGGETSTFDTPLARTPGIVVRTPWDRRAGAFAVLRELAAPGLRENPRCPALVRRTTTSSPIPPLLLVTAPGDVGPVPRWFVGSWHTARYGDTVVDALLPAGAAVEIVPGAAKPRIHLFSRAGWRAEFDLAAGTRSERPSLLGSTPHGVGCAAKIGHHWWLVDPVLGTIRSTDPQSSWVPAGSWAGITSGPGGELILAAADQWIAIYDVPSRSELRRFPAAVWPSRRATAGECSPVLAGEGWYATLNNLTSVLSVYDRDGRLIGHRRLDRLLGLGSVAIQAVGGGGRVLGVAHPFSIDSLEVQFSSDCSG